MDAIKKKLVALREETDRAVAKANAAEEAANVANHFKRAVSLPFYLHQVLAELEPDGSKLVD